MIDMDKGNLNKLVTNYPVELTPEEVENLSQTLSSVRTAREDDKTYTGEGFVNVNNTNNVISLTNEANEKLNQPIPTKVSDLTDSASYQTVSGMDEYLTKTSASENLAPLSITADIESLKNASSDWNKVSAKLDTTAFSTVSGNYAFKNDLNDYYQKTETSSKGELDIAFESKQDKLIFGYDENNAISSINNTTLAGQDVTTYSAGKYIEIDENNTISVTGLMPLNEYAQYEPVLIGDSNITATSSKVDSHTQWNLAINSKPVVTDTKLVGENSITAHTTNVSGEWVVGLEESAHNSIASVAGIATDVGTLKTASAGWDKVSAKLDVTSFSTVSGTFLTEIPDTYATKNDLNTASSTLTGVDNDLSGHIDYVSAHSITSLDDYYTKTQVNSTFALKTEIPTTVTQLTDSGNYYQKTETSSKTEITNALNTKVDNPSQQTGLLVYDGDISAWVSMPPDTTIVQGQGSITSNYESNSTYTVSLLASAENALKKVVNKIDTTAVEQKYQTKDDMSNYLTTSEASTTYQPIGDYATTSDISDMATQTWVGQQGFYTKASADNDYAPKTITATVNTLTGASASWNEVSAISRIESDLENKKDKQTELNFNGSATKTIKKITQYPNGELNVEFENIDLPQEVPNVEITSEDNSVKVTETTDVQTNTKKFDLSVQDGGTTYSAGDAIDLTNDTISVKYGKGIEITTDNKLQLKVGKGLTIDNNTLELTIKDLETSITSFRTGDVIAVDGPSGTAKMSKDDLLNETAENALADNVVHAFDDTKNYIVGNIVEYNGIVYRFRQNHSKGPWNVNEVEQATIYEELKTTLRMSKNLLNPSAIYDGYFFASQATFDEGTGKTATDNYACFKFDCKPNTTYCVTGTSFIVQLYRSDNVRVRSIGDYFNNHAFSFTTGPRESFFTISFKTYVYKTWEYMVVEGSTLPSKFEPYGKFVSGSEYKNMQDVYDVLSEITELKFPTNVYDGTHYSGKTMDSYGALSDNESRSVTGFIRVESGKKYFVSSNSVKCGFVRVVQFADDLSVVRNDTNAYDFTTEATTRYIRLCTTTALMEDKFMITSEGYVDYEAYEPIKVIPKVNAESAGEMTRIIVKADGSGDFSSLYAAVTYANSIASEDNEVDVVIVDTSTNHTGTEFDIFAEMYNSDVSNIPLTPKTFAGLPLNGYVNLIGVGKVKLLCHLPDDATLEQTEHMSVVDCNSAVYCENLTFEAKNCRYPFHDESLNLVPKTTHKFKNCKFTHLGNKAGQWESPHAIGIGFSEACKFEFVDCIFDSSASGGYPFLAHNYAPQLGTQITLTNCVMVGEKSGTSIALEFNGYSPATSNPTKYYACFNDVFLSNIIATGNIHVYKTNSGYSCTNNYVVHNFTDLSVVAEPDWIVP